jgi:PTS system galactitol-specific IIB component
MAKRKLTILAVCGSGVVSSSMVEQKVGDLLKSIADVKVIGTLPQGVQSYIDRGEVDFIVTTSPLPDNLGVPVIKGVALLTGMGEEAVLEQIKQVAQSILAAGT